VKKWTLIILLFIIVNIFLGCVTARIQSELILNDEYFQIAHREIQNAKESVHLVAYLFLLYDYKDAYSNRLLRDFIDARTRGLDVYVVLDYPKSEYIKEETLKNQEVFNKLKAAGINVRFDSSKRTTHSKVLVIDKETIIIGSHNYSFDGLKNNNDTSLLLRDKDKAKRLIEYIEHIE